MTKITFRYSNLVYKTINGFIQIRSISRLLSWVKISSTKVTKSLIVNLFCAISDKMGTKSFASW